MKTKTCNDYLDDLAALNRQEGGTGTDYAVAKMMGVSPSRIYNYRRGVSQFDDEMVFQVAKALEINPAEIIAAINVERAKSEEKKKFWRDSYKRVSGGAAAVMLSLAIMLGLSPSPASASTALKNVYYVKRRRYAQAASILLFCGLFFSSTPQASADTLSRADWQREAAYLVLHLADWGQTLDIAARPDRFEEQNPILGPHPSRGAVNRYFAITALAHLGITALLPAEYRPAWQYTTIAVEAGVTLHNARIGVRVRF